MILTYNANYVCFLFFHCCYLFVYLPYVYCYAQSNMDCITNEHFWFRWYKYKYILLLLLFLMSLLCKEPLNINSMYRYYLVKLRWTETSFLPPFPRSLNAPPWGCGSIPRWLEAADYIMGRRSEQWGSEAPRHRGTGTHRRASHHLHLHLHLHCQRAPGRVRASPRRPASGPAACRRMEIEKRTNGFDFPERSTARSVNGRRPRARSCMPTHTHVHTEPPSPPHERFTAAADPPPSPSRARVRWGWSRRRGRGVRVRPGGLCPGCTRKFKEGALNASRTSAAGHDLRPGGREMFASGKWVDCLCARTCVRVCVCVWERWARWEQRSECFYLEVEIVKGELLNLAGSPQAPRGRASRGGGGGDTRGHFEELLF